MLADFVDERTLGEFVNAPVGLTVLDALLHALRGSFGQLSAEDVALENVRNELIRTVPELRRRLLAEMIRPVRLIADGICRREGRPAGDPAVLAYAGALVGGLMLGAAGADEEGIEVGDDFMAEMETRIERLRPILRLPDAATP